MRRSKRVEQRGHAAARSARSTVWIARGAVDVDDGGDAVAPLRRARRARRACTGDGIGPRLKISRGALGQHHRRDRAELLAALDVVEALEVRRAAGIGQQAAVAERARAELAAPLEPGDDAVGGQHLGHRVRESAGRSYGDAGGRAASRLDLVVVRQPRPRAAVGIGCDAVAQARATCSARAERRAGVAGGGLHPDLVERALARTVACWRRS